MPVLHLVARCQPPHAPLLRGEGAFWLWDQLRALVPAPLAVVQMPNHIHILVEHPAPGELRLALARLLGQWARLFGPDGFAWQEVPKPELVVGGQKLRRSVRYIVLNPCRAGLTRDPLDWVFTTHRDVVGATADPWVSADFLSRACGFVRPRSAEWWHRWVSGDPSVEIAGTEPPIPAEPGEVATEPLVELARAAASAVRGTLGDLRRPGLARTLFLELARRHGWRQVEPLAEACGLTPRSIRRVRATSPGERALAAGELCLGDARLRSRRGLVLPDEWALSRPRRRRHRPRDRPRTPARAASTSLSRLARWLSARGKRDPK